VLDDVERWRFLVEPARKNPIPALVGLLDVELNKRTGQLFFFPWRGGFAGTEPDDQVFPPGRLARMERDRLHDSVALVEDAKNRDPLRHRRHAPLARGSGCNLPCRRKRHILLGLLAARHKRERDHQRCRDGSHAYSGIQGL
jgi:hypothetical protein